ncbi:unnamed protein product [Cuscuta epithymum]|uniref:NAD(P)-binding domain-containing protein n=1 Tax=Cuscuta epithymum TaxID=186058 RepID=A0AAV0F3X8_9ASTE|nr:unnamed protein product [Cuscuta epithymum]
MDQILDYIEGGPKLRKWYGAPDTLSKDRPLDMEGEASDEDQVRDAVLVTDGDNEIGQMIILSLIVKRTRVKVLVKDKKAAREAFGTYVEPIVGDVKNQSCLKTALKGVRAVIFSSEGSASNIQSWNGLQHVILLSQLYAYRGASGIQALIISNARKLAEQDERAVLASGIPCTIIRTGSLTNVPGGQQGFSFEEGSAGLGKLSKEDAAFLCVEALDVVPQTGLVFEVVNGKEKVLDWRKCFAGLMKKSLKPTL